MRTFLVIFVIAFFTESAYSQRAFKCVDERGSVIYQQTPCEDAAEVEEMRFDGAPRLTADEEFRRTAFELGLTPDELRKILHDQKNPPPREPEIIVVTAPEPQAPAQPARSQRMATRCTRPTGEIYYTLGSCGKSFVDAVFGDATLLLADTGEPAPYSEACEWANQEASNTRLSSNKRRSARTLARTVC